MDFPLAGLANKHAIQQVPAAQGQENNPQIVQARRRHAYQWRATFQIAASATLISCVALAVLVSFKLFFLVGAAAFLARRSVMKELTINGMEPNNGAYKDILRANFGITAQEEGDWNEFNPVGLNIAGYHIFMGALPDSLLPAALAPEQANADQAPAPVQAAAQAPVGAQQEGLVNNAAAAAQRRMDQPIVPQPDVAAGQQADILEGGELRELFGQA